MKKRISIILFIIICNCIVLHKDNLIAKEKITVYFFYGDGCPQCEEIRPTVTEIVKKYKLPFKQYEVWYNDANRNRLLSMAAKRKMKVKGVPVVIIGNDVLFGKKKISTLENVVKKYKK